MKKKLGIVFFFLLTISLLLVFADAYGLLESKGDAEVRPEIGKWNITLNDYNIVEEKTITVSDLEYDDNENVQDGFIAPGSRATYKIVVNPNDTDVAIRYDISIDSSVIEDHPNIVFEVTDANNVRLDNNGDVFTGVITLADINDKKNVVLNLSLVWENDEDLNEIDSDLIGLENLDLVITIRFSQYTGENF